MNEDRDVLLVDDDTANLPRIAQALSSLKVSVSTAANGAEALDVLLRSSGPHGFPGIVVSDLKMPVMDGLEFLVKVLKRDADLPVILLSAYGEVATAVEAMKVGAYDFIERPFNMDDLLSKVARALDKRRLVLDNRRLKTALANRAGISARLIGNSPVIQALRDEIANVGSTDVTVLIRGETGAGKEVVARALHDCSNRAKARFVAINCGALSETLIDSELFGHEPGAFTDAKQRRIGIIEYARGGTLFLDEVESMPPNLQVKLLRMLQERVITRLGSNEEIRVDIRVIAATKSDLLEAARRREFREDLYFRLGVAELQVPPLSERRGDIPLLLEHFGQEFASRHQRPVPVLSMTELEGLIAHNWRGNVRELRNVAERLVLGLGRRPDGIVNILASEAGHPKPLPVQLDEIEAVFVGSALRECNGNIQAAADRLGIPRRTLSEKMRRHGLERKDYQ